MSEAKYEGIVQVNHEQKEIIRKKKRNRNSNSPGVRNHNVELLKFF